jgi:hypothetical protein
MEITLTDDFLHAALELRYVTAEIAKLEAQAKRCKEILAKHLTIGDTGMDPDGNALVKVVKGSARFKPELAIANLPAGVLDSIMVTAPDAKRAKDVLPPALYALACEDNAPSIRIA